MVGDGSRVGTGSGEIARNWFVMVGDVPRVGTGYEKIARN